MIVNDKEKFVFIHIPKTAGVSLRKVMTGNLVEPKHQYANNIKDKYKDYFMFSFVRNPWERLLSLHTFGVKGGWIKHKNFKLWLLKKDWWEAEETRFGQHEERLPHQRRPMCDWLMNEDKEIVVDFVGRFEFLQRDVDVIRKKYNITIGSIPHLNRSNHQHYSGKYDIEMEEFVAHHHKLDLETFGYTFKTNEEDI